MGKKVGEVIPREFWDRLELKLKIRNAEYQFKGWKAAVLREFLINGAAMTIDGAHSFIAANGMYKIDSKAVIEFLFKQHDDGLLISRKEPMSKTPHQSRLVFVSALHPEMVQHQIIVHEEKK